MFQCSLIDKDRSGSGFSSWKTVPAVPVPLLVSGKTVLAVLVSSSRSVLGPPCSSELPYKVYCDHFESSVDGDEISSKTSPEASLQNLRSKVLVAFWEGSFLTDTDNTVCKLDLPGNLLMRSMTHLQDLKARFVANITTNTTSSRSATSIPGHIM